MANKLFPLEALPAAAPQLPSMMSQDEVDLLFSIAKYYFSGEGKIVDAGIFLGASTNAFVQGLKRNAAWRSLAPGIVHSYDRAVVTEPMTRLFPGLLPDKGQDYSSILRDKIAHLGDMVCLHIGDICEEKPFGEPIEILFLDILKNPAIFARCNRIFMPYMIPGKTIVIQQDYYWHLDWWINAYMMLYSDCFRMIDQAVGSCVFLYVKQLPDTAFGNPFGGMKIEEILALLHRAQSQAVTVFQYLMSELCVIFFLLRKKRYNDVRQGLETFAARYSPILSDDSIQYRRVRYAYQDLTNRLKIQEPKGLFAILSGRWYPWRGSLPAKGARE